MGCGGRAGRSSASGSSKPQKMLAKQGRNYLPWPPPFSCAPAHPQGDGGTRRRSSASKSSAVAQSKRHPPPCKYTYLRASRERARAQSGCDWRTRGCRPSDRPTRTSRCRADFFFVPSRVADRVAVAVAICFTTSRRESRRSIAICLLPFSGRGRQ